MMTIDEIATAGLEKLTDELAAAGWDSTMTDRRDAQQAVARLINEAGALHLWDSETGELVADVVSDEDAAESAVTPEGHILVDGRKCYVA